jgi:hypothetical protein
MENAWYCIAWKLELAKEALGQVKENYAKSDTNYHY